MFDVTQDSYADHVEGHVLLDVWGPDCQPCIALMPAVEELARAYEGRVTVLKLEAPDNRALCRQLRVAGLPTYITMRHGEEVERLTGNGVTIDAIDAALVRLLSGAPVTGLPVPEHLREGGEHNHGAAG